MKRIVLKLISEHTNLGVEPSITETKVHKKYDYLSTRINDEVLKELFESIRTIREDWIAFKVTADNHNMYADITFLSMSQEESQLEIPSGVIEIADDFFKYEALLNLLNKNEDHSFLDRSANYRSVAGSEVESDDKFEENAKGVLIKFTEHTTNNSEGSEFINLLKKKNVQFDEVTTNVLSTDVGASSVVIENIVYIHEVVQSGLTYDIIKAGILLTFPFIGKQLDENTIDDINYKKLLKSVSLRAQVDEQDLTLSDMHSTDSEIIFDFKVGDSIITVICNTQYVIKDYYTKQKD